MAKVSKNQRTNRGQSAASTRMAKIVVAQKKENGQYRFKQKMVSLDEVRQEAQAIARA